MPYKSQNVEDPIEVIQHTISDKPRLGANGAPYKEKKYSIKKRKIIFI